MAESNFEEDILYDASQLMVLYMNYDSAIKGYDVPLEFIENSFKKSINQIKWKTSGMKYVIENDLVSFKELKELKDNNIPLPPIYATDIDLSKMKAFAFASELDKAHKLNFALSIKKEYEQELEKKEQIVFVLMNVITKEHLLVDTKEKCLNKMANSPDDTDIYNLSIYSAIKNSNDLIIGEKVF